MLHIGMGFRHQRIFPVIVGKGIVVQIAVLKPLCLAALDPLHAFTLRCGLFAFALCFGLTGADAPGHKISRLAEVGNNRLPLTFAGFAMDQAVGWVNILVCGQLCRSGIAVDPRANFLGYLYHTVSPSRTL